MSWVSSVSAEQASPEVRNVYSFLQEKWGLSPTISGRLAAILNCFRTK